MFLTSWVHHQEGRLCIQFLYGMFFMHVYTQSSRWKSVFKHMWELMYPDVFSCLVMGKPLFRTVKFSVCRCAMKWLVFSLISFLNQNFIQPLLVKPLNSIFAKSPCCVFHIVVSLIFRHIKQLTIFCSSFIYLCIYIQCYINSYVKNKFFFSLCFSLYIPIVLGTSVPFITYW